MNKLEIEYKFKAGEPVWFMRHNEISKGVVSRIDIDAETNGLESRGYKVKEFFNRILKPNKIDNEFKIRIVYTLDLLYFDSENYKSTPHYRKENEVFPTKDELIKSL